MASALRERLIYFSLDTFFSQAYWRIVSVQPPRPIVGPLYIKYLELVSSINLYTTQP